MATAETGPAGPAQRDGAEQLLAAARAGHVGSVQRLLAAGVPLSDTKGGCGALHVAAFYGHAALIAELLSALPLSAVDAPAEAGWTALMLAARQVGSDLSHGRRPAALPSCSALFLQGWMHAWIATSAWLGRLAAAVGSAPARQLSAPI